ncbi:endonuclease/exonuclease/phosphatase family protein [Klebsiella pneumoniae]|uniref:endonuclease/exonuclease/phosphatase family protein n=1 Tax=Klebsiella pneumoniae TaxID=573 RepID=UPI003CFE5FF9
MRSVSADIVCLQEVMGAHEVHPLHHRKLAVYRPIMNFSPTPCGVDYAYGAMRFIRKGHHGNAVLSRFPIEYYENRDIYRSATGRSAACCTCRIVPPRSGDNYSRDLRPSRSTRRPTAGRS